MNCRTGLSISEKLFILNEIRVKKKTRQEVCKEFNLPKTTLSRIVKDEIKIRKLAGGGCLNRIRMKKAHHQELEGLLYKFYVECQNNNIPVNGPMLKKEASSLATSLNITNFKCSTGWFHNWKKRYIIERSSILLEEEDLPLKEEEDFPDLGRSLHVQPDDIINLFPPEDRYAFHEFGLFFSALPENTLVLKDSKCQNGAHCKVRVTVGLCANQTGTDKLKPILVGRYGSPRCFKNVKLDDLPVHYYSNKRAWMTTDIFQQFLVKMNFRAAAQQKNILLMVDEAPCHKLIELTNVQVVFLPSDSAVDSQPLKNGVIEDVKVKYRKKLLQYYLGCVDKGLRKENFPKWDIIRVALTLEEVWGEIMPEVVSNSWRTAGFDHSNPILETESAEELQELSHCCIQYFKKLNLKSPHFFINDYIRIDDNVITNHENGEDVSNETNAAAETADGDKSDSDRDEPSSQIVPPSRSAVLDALHVLRQVKYIRPDAPKEFGEVFSELEEMMYTIYN